MKCSCGVVYEVALGQRMNLCPPCKAERKRQKQSERVRRWVIANPDKARQKSRKHHHLLRLDVIENYGGRCICCGETEPQFLELDHVDNDGSSHRAALNNGRRRGGGGMARWARDNGYPKTLQLLCCNCNRSKHLNGGACIHQTPQR